MTADNAQDTSRKPVPPGLHFIATPIGAARDITLRALDLLAGADLLAAEDTRSLRHLMEIHNIALNDRPLVPYHDHNGARMRPRLIEALSRGQSVVYASEAGTPLVADPGFQLARAAIAEGHPVLAAPGPSAVLAALTVAGLPTDRFCFMGFPPPKGGARRAFLAEALDIPATLVLYESPKRINRLLDELAETDGARDCALCRELTKRFEEVVRGSIEQVRQSVTGRELRGEIVLVLGRRAQTPQDAAALDSALEQEMKGQSLRAAVDAVSTRTGLPRRVVYQAALARDRKDDDDGTETG